MIAFLKNLLAVTIMVGYVGGITAMIIHAMTLEMKGDPKWWMWLMGGVSAFILLVTGIITARA